MNQDFITTYQQDIALMFKDYGINQPVTKETILDAIKIQGKPFLEDFALLVETKNASFDGKPKKMSTEQIMSIVGGVLSTAGTVAGAFGSQPSATQQTTVSATEDNTKKDKEKEDKKNMYIIAAAIVTIVLLLLAVLFVKKK